MIDGLLLLVACRVWKVLLGYLRICAYVIGLSGIFVCWFGDFGILLFNPSCLLSLLRRVGYCLACISLYILHPL